MHRSFVGTGVAIVTPFGDGKVDRSSLHRIVDHLIEGGVEYLVPLGSTGEGATIDIVEERVILDEVINHVQGRVPIVAGCFGGNDTRALTSKIKGYDFDGIDAILSASPAYNKPSQRGLIEHYTRVADTSAVPVILYNVPGRTAGHIHPDTVIELSHHDHIIGIKEASGDLSITKAILRGAADNFFVTSGDDELAPAIIQSGGVGVISVLANALPRQFSDMVRAFINGDLEIGRKIENTLFPLHDCMYAEGNPSGIKSAMEIIGLCAADVRLPLTAIGGPLKSRLVQLLREIS